MEATPSATLPILPCSTAIFTTDKCSVRPFEPSDAEALAALANDPEVAKTLRDRFPRPYTLADAHSWIGYCRGGDPVLQFAVCAPDGSLAGAIGLEAARADVSRCTRELGYWLGRRYWKMGIAGAAARAFVRWAFAALPELLRIEAGVFEGNVASEGVLYRAGFVKEGVRRCAVFKDGMVLDDAMFGLTRRDVEEG
ncbi:acyl-CoA N-acyltransferase [Biscogniauxia marginata]|nr:acyl-CoA N-acyltransferase [Biscogniauxia marginata]